VSQVLTYSLTSAYIDFHSRVCTLVHYAVLEAIRAVYGIWQIWPPL